MTFFFLSVMEFFASSFILLVFLLLCSAFFSGSETAMFSLNSIRLQHLEKKGSATARIVSNFLKRPSKLLVTILIGNEVVNIFASSTAASLCVRFFGEQAGPIVATVSMTILLLIFGEVTPKTFAVQFPQKYAFFVSRPLLLFSKIVFPIRIILTGIADLILRLIGGGSRKSHERLLTGQEFRTLLNVSEREGVVEATERKMIDNLFDFSEMTVKEIMIPRTDMLCFSLDSSFDDILERCRTELHAKVPVYEETLDNIAGIVYVKNLLPFIQARRQEFTLKDFLREAYFIPETKKVQDLLKDFQEKKIHIAIVVDEYGGTSGLVCLEDVLEEIIGEISDEFDTDNLPWCVGLEEGRRYKVNAMMHIHEFNQEFSTDFSQEFYGTVAGLFLHELGRIPKKGDTVKLDDLSLTVTKLHNIRILELLVTREGNRPQEQESLKA